MLSERIREFPSKSFVGIETCNSILIYLKLGGLWKFKNVTDIKTTTKQWIMKYATEGQPFLIAVFSKETKSEICIGIVNNVIMRSQLLGGIDLNERNLDYKLGNGDVKMMWCKTLNPHKDKMKIE